MGFPNQFATDQFFNQRIKALKVIGEVPNVNEFGSVSGVALPDGVTAVGQNLVSTTTGQPVTVSVTPSAGFPISPGAITIIPGMNGKIANSMTIVVDVTAVVDGATVPIAMATPITIAAVVETGTELQPNDIVQKHDVQFRGSTVVPMTVAGVTTLTITAIVELCIVIARETIFKINAAELFCR